MKDQPTGEHDPPKRSISISTHRRHATILLLVSCVALGAAAFSSSSTGASIAQVNAAASTLNSDYNSYMQLYEQQTPSNPAGWSAFFSTGKNRVGQLRTDFIAWSNLLNQAHSAGNIPDPGPVLAYRDAMGVWLADQEEQARDSSACFDGGKLTTTQATECFSQAITSSLSRWQADNQKLQQLGEAGAGATGTSVP